MFLELGSFGQEISPKMHSVVIWVHEVRCDCIYLKLQFYIMHLIIGNIIIRRLDSSIFALTLKILTLL